LTSKDQEVERLVRLGATVVERYGDITVMRDPEGNEFCVEPGPDDPHEPSGR
jgi:Glyoxalase-like domain